MIAKAPHSKVQVEVRDAVEQDRQRLANLIHFEMHVHRHLDWQAPLEWVGRNPFIVGLQGSELVGALASPIDPPGVAWLRLFAASNRADLDELWRLLWEQASMQLSRLHGCTAAAIPLQGWMIDLLSRSGFTHGNDVILLMWESGQRMPEPERETLRGIRQMVPADLEQVALVDEASFHPLWRNSLESVSLALEQAAVATVIEDESGIIGYQISTSSHMGGHIARLAVHPGHQGRNIGYALVYDVVRQFEKRMVFRVTVNTQRDNTVSQSLYLKAGFSKTGETYPVYLKQIP